MFGFTAGTRRGPSPAATHRSTHNSRSSPFLQTRCLFITSPLHKSYTIAYAAKKTHWVQSEQNRGALPRFTADQLRVRIPPEYTHERLIDGYLLIAWGSSSVCDFQELFWLENTASSFWTQSGPSSQWFRGQPALNKDFFLLEMSPVFSLNVTPRFCSKISELYRKHLGRIGIVGQLVTINTSSY